MSTERHWEGHGRAGIRCLRLGDTQPTGRGSAESLGCCDWMDSRQRRDVICASESVIPKPGSPPRPLPLSLFLRLLLLAGAPPAGRIRTTRRQPRSIMRRRFRCRPKWPIQRPPPGSSSIPAEIAGHDPRIWPLQTAARHQTKGKKKQNSILLVHVSISELVCWSSTHFCSSLAEELDSRQPCRLPEAKHLTQRGLSP